MAKGYPIYRSFLKLYPRPYREKYGSQMVQTLDDMLHDQVSPMARLGTWLRVSFDLPVSLMQQNLIYIGGLMKAETPQYVKRNSLIACGLIMPFFVVVFSRALQHNQIRSSFVWQSSLWMTLVLLPLLAFLLCVYTFAKWSHGRKVSFWHSVLDLRRNWMMTIIGGLALLIALFVPFHDSVHCVTGNPVSEVRNYHQTWQCIWRG